MNIAVFSDKFSGTLSAIEVLDIITNKFLDSNINADFFSVTDGGQESTEIFKSYNFQINESFETFHDPFLFLNKALLLSNYLE